MVIAVDFDGTCVTHEYPNIGREIGAIPILKKLVENGHLLILNTMRSYTDILTESNNTLSSLEMAINWFQKNNIPLWGINEHPTQKGWTTSPKVYANLYIDDAALGIPLIEDKTISMKPFVNWKEVDRWLFMHNFYHFTLENEK